MPCYWAPCVDLRHSLHSYPNIYTTEVLEFWLAHSTQKQTVLLYTVHHVVEHRFIVHLYEFIQSSIALSKSMPFTLCILSFANKFSHHAQSTILIPLISASFSTQEMAWALNLPHFDFMSSISVTATCGTVQWLCFPLSSPVVAMQHWFLTCAPWLGHILSDFIDTGLGLWLLWAMLQQICRAT